MSKQDLSRRKILQMGAAGLAATSLGLSPLTALAQSRPSGAPRRAKNIILCVSDGMSMGVMAMVDHYLQRTTGKPSPWSALKMRPGVTHGFQDTRALSGLVTDSAAASSSWGAGRHVWNGMLSCFPKNADPDDFIPLRPLLRILKEDAKMATGLVSTATITHATPAGFAVSHPHRDEEEKIAQKLLEADVDVLFGGGNRFFSPQLRKDKLDLYAQFAARKYGVARTRAEMKALDRSQRWLGIFSDSHMPYSVDHQNSAALRDSTPTLKEMTQKALDKLKGSSQGFFLQIEGARIDHGAHANDIAATLGDQLAFEEALAVVLEFAAQDRETLVIVTSDHGNSNPGLNGAGMEYFESTAGLDTLTGMKSSYGPIFELLKGREDRTSVQDVVKDRLGLTLDAASADLVVLALLDEKFKTDKEWRKRYPLAFVDQYQIRSSALSLAIQNVTHIGWTGRQHTNDHTIVTAWGPGQEAFSGLTMNIDWFQKFLDHRGLKVDQPRMTYDEAKKRLDEQKARNPGALIMQPHWI
ncbi:MAG TPA: alkaline phosphatase [Fimbriimonadaceae bacterium]|nr:alkaline phosphatase [Fimbriimonadaceae bacterium]HRJ33015.1 alkaline phosphatase [Fimbriimonadaceae bacterium]